MKFKYKNQILSGACTGLLVWVILTLADAFDEFILDTDSCICVIVFYFLPIAMFITYIVHNVKHKPSFKKLLIWFGSYCVVFLPLWWIIYDRIKQNTYIVLQRHRGEWWDFGGREYMLYGFWVCIDFSVLCLIFSLIYFIAQEIKKSHSIPKE